MWRPMVTSLLLGERWVWRPGMLSGWLLCGPGSVERWSAALVSPSTAILLRDATLPLRLSQVSARRVDVVVTDGKPFRPEPETASATIEWRSGNDINMRVGSTSVGLCTDGCDYVWAGPTNHWYTTTAGHCQFEVGADGFLYDGSSGNVMSGAGSPSGAWSFPDVSAWYLNASAPGTKPGPASRNVLNYCDGTPLCANDQTAFSMPVVSKVTPNTSGQFTYCKSGARTGTNCGVAVGVEINGGIGATRHPDLHDAIMFLR